MMVINIFVDNVLKCRKKMMEVFFEIPLHPKALHHSHVGNSIVTERLIA